MKATMYPDAFDRAASGERAVVFIDDGHGNGVIFIERQLDDDDFDLRGVCPPGMSEADFKGLWEAAIEWFAGKMREYWFGPTLISLPGTATGLN